MKIFKKLLILYLSITLVLVKNSSAQVQYLELEGFLDERNVMDARITVTFEDFVNRFEVMIFGRVYGFNYSSNAKVRCSLSSGEVSLISCSLNLTPEFRTLEILFKTRDLVKKMDKSLVFKGDLSTNLDVDNLILYIKLPEGFLLSEKQKISPPNFRTLSDGRRIIVMWELRNVSKHQIQSFLILYESAKPFGSAVERWRYLFLAFLVFPTLFYLHFHRKSKEKEAVLSVLNKNEKKVMDVVLGYGGKVDQRKIVAETNFSKPKVTRIVKELKERGLVEVERKGRKNIIKFVRKR